MLIISVDRNVNDTLKFNQETEFVPILGLIASNLNKSKTESPASEERASSVQKNHHPELLALLAGELSVAPEEIHDFELYVLVISKQIHLLTHFIGHYTILNHLF